MKSLARSVGSYAYVEAGPFISSLWFHQEQSWSYFLSPRFVLWMSEGLKSPGCHRCPHQPAGGSGTDVPGG